jgi:hypothetical protein
MKNLIFSIPVILLFASAYGQHNIIPQPVGPLYVDNATFNSFASTNNIFYNGDIIIPSPAATVTFPQNGPVNVISNHRIMIHPGVTMQPAVTDRILCSIAPTDLSVAIFSPLQQSNAQPLAYQNEKFELGLKLPQNIFAAVEAFCNHDPLFPGPINPFNPEELNVYAVFTKINSNNTGTVYPDVYGFYYREFSRNMSNAQRSNWGWNLDTTSFTFRIRFSPPLIGLWSVRLVVECPSIETIQTNLVYFNCQPSLNPNNKGYVHTVTNKKYFELGTEMFYPIGENIPGPAPFSYSDYGYGHGQFGWLPIGLAAYVDYEQRLDFLASNGGNFFRMLTAPWTTEIEFEHLNDYSERLYGPWEMDHILDVCNEKNLYLDLNLDYFLGTDKTSAYGSWFWDWRDDQLPCPPDFLSPPDLGYCYHSELGLAEPQEMYTNAQAKKYYKYRLRYLISRYGYSRNIAMMELVNEIDVTCADRNVIIDPQGFCAVGNVTNQPYVTDLVFRNNVAIWQTEMSNYIKNSIYFGTHLLTVSYGTTPKNGDDSYLTANIDVNDFNYYDNYLRINKNRSINQIDYGLNSIYNRPIFLSETGSTLILCSNYTEWIRTVWSMPFTGCAGGLNWPGPNPNTSLYYNFSNLKTFLEGENFNDGEWQPIYTEQSDHLAETLYLKKWDPAHNNCVAATGVVLNKSFNTYNMRDDNLGDCYTYYMNNQPNDLLESPSNPIYHISDVNPPADDDDKILLTQMGSLRTFDIDWFDPSTGAYIWTGSRVSRINGNLELDYPTLQMTSGFRPILAFKIKAHNENTGRHADPGITSYNNTVIARQDTLPSAAMSNIGFDLFPNPVTNSIIIHPSNNSMSYSLEIFSIAGKQTFISVENTVGEKRIDVTSLTPGVYLAKVNCDRNIYFLKFIKTE